MEILPQLAYKDRMGILLLTLICLTHLAFRQSPFLRLSAIHGIATLSTLALFPPAPSLPPIAIPIIWAASLCASLTLVSLAKLMA